MPTYDYQCEGCGHTFEEFQYFSEEPLKECPRCHEARLRRLFGTGAAVLFKGSGFYETDYRSASYKAAAKKEAESGKAPAGSNGTGGTGNTNGTATTGSADSGTKSPSNSPKSSG
jgi:putative FmdB family regulatory protein